MVGALESLEASGFFLGGFTWHCPRKVEVLNELKFPNHDGPKQFFNSKLQWNDGVVISSLRKKTDKLFQN